MTTAVSPQAASAQAVVLPKNRGAYYGGAWHEPKAGRFVDTISAGTGQSLGKVADSGAEDIDAAVAVAHQTPDQVGSHPAKSHHSQLHRCIGCHRPSFPRTRWTQSCSQGPESISHYY